MAKNPNIKLVKIIVKLETKENKNWSRKFLLYKVIVLNPIVISLFSFLIVKIHIKIEKTKLMANAIKAFIKVDFIIFAFSDSMIFLLEMILV